MGGEWRHLDGGAGARGGGQLVVDPLALVAKAEVDASLDRIAQCHFSRVMFERPVYGVNGGTAQEPQ